jgi:hypothetical protein
MDEWTAAGCRGKEAFKTFEAAAAVNDRSRTRGRGSREVYRCPTCHQYHLGTPNPRSQKNSARRRKRKIQEIIEHESGRRDLCN